jgi:glycosyltransferase involved in cell wall biosynthesis
MHVLVNAISANLGGGITVLRNLVHGFLQVDEGANLYTVFIRKASWSKLGIRDYRVRPLIVPDDTTRFSRRLFWEQLALPARLMNAGEIVLFSPANLAVFGTDVAQVLMVQNVAPFDDHVVSLYPPAERLRLLLLRELGLLSCRLADRTIFISDFARRSIGKASSTPHDRTRLVYLGRDPIFCPADTTRPKVFPAIESPYILAVSQFYRYKNLVQLVKGYARLRRSRRVDPPLLCIAGAEAEPAYAAEVRATVTDQGVEGKVRFLGSIPYSALPDLYRGAEICVFPSVCENFPNILVEGMACGVPTLASNREPMPEIAGDGAMYFDSEDPTDLERGLETLLGDSVLRRSLAARGLAKARTYAWPECAQQVLQAMKDALNDKRSHSQRHKKCRTPDCA